MISFSKASRSGSSSALDSSGRDEDAALCSGSHAGWPSSVCESHSKSHKNFVLWQAMTLVSSAWYSTTLRSISDYNVTVIQGTGSAQVMQVSLHSMAEMLHKRTCLRLPRSAGFRSCRPFKRLPTWLFINLVLSMLSCLIFHGCVCILGGPRLLRLCSGGI